MARKGGYKIINLKDIEITTNESVHIDGIYEAIESTNKAILLSGAVVDKIELDDFYILFESSTDASFVGVEGDNQITVKDDDTLLWEVYAPSGVALKEGDGIKIEGDVISADLSGLITEEEFNSFNTGLSQSLDTRFAAKQDMLVSGENIEITDNSISAPNVATKNDLDKYATSEYVANINSQLMNDIAGKQDVLTAGNNIAIDNNIISATQVIYTRTWIPGTALTLNFKYNAGVFAIGTSNNIVKVWVLNVPQITFGNINLYNFNFSMDVIQTDNRYAYYKVNLGNLSADSDGKHIFSNCNNIYGICDMTGEDEPTIEFVKGLDVN